MGNRNQMKAFKQTSFLPEAPPPKTYRAIRHDVVRKRQAENADDAHHPGEKIAQIQKVLGKQKDLKILELFAGEGNLTAEYEKRGEVFCYDKKLGTGDSYIVFHELIGMKYLYDVIDLDPYGFPNRFFPDIFLLIESGFMFITMPKPWVNIPNGITRKHLENYYGMENPSLETIYGSLYRWGLCHWREIEALDIIDLGRLWRIALRVERVKATEYCGVRNR
jgi:hypothetical protein